jgi:tetratricopeptide (TPR) repeat protein
MDRSHRPNERNNAFGFLTVSIGVFLGFAFLLAPQSQARDLANFDKPADTGELNEQLAAATKNILANKRSAQAYFERGEIQFKLRAFDKAVEDFNQALALNDKLDEAYFGRGMAHGRGGDLDRAIEDLSVYLTRHPASSLGFTKRGVRYLWKGDLEKAEADFNKALAIDPTNAEAHDDLGVICAQRGDYAVAEEHFLATIRSEPTYQKGHHNLALVYAMTGKFDRSLASVNRALALSTQHRDAWLLKATVLEALGKQKEAAAARDEAEFLPAHGATERMPLQ